MDIKRYIFRKAAAGHIPVSGTFELTPRCNLSCEMCYIRMSAAEQSSYGTELTAEQWLALGRETVDAGMAYLLLTGGEPLLRPDFEQIYTGLAELGLMLTLNTNGTRITEGTVRCLEEHPPEKINVTLYGASGETYRRVCGSAGGYEAAIRGIALLREAGLPLCLNTTFTRHNAADMERIVSFAKENGIPIRMTSYLFPPLRCGREANESCFLPPEEFGRLGAAFDSLTMNADQKKRRAELLAQIRQKSPALPDRGRAASCMAGRGAFWVTWDGRLLPCGMLPELGAPLKEAGFSALWAGFGEKMDAQRLPGACSGCPRRILCPVCAAVTQSADEPPEALCRYCGSYMEAMARMRENGAD